MGNVLRPAADQHESSSGDPGGVFDCVCRLPLPVVVLDEIAASDTGCQEFLDDLLPVVVLDVDQVLALRRAVVPVDERLPALEEDDQEHRPRLQRPLLSQPFPELCAFVYIRDRLELCLSPFDEGLEGLTVLDLFGSRPGLGRPVRQHDQCQNGESQRSLAVQSHRILLIRIKYEMQPDFTIRPDPDSLHRGTVHHLQVSAAYKSVPPPPGYPVRIIQSGNMRSGVRAA